MRCGLGIAVLRVTKIDMEMKKRKAAGCGQRFGEYLFL